MNTLPKIKKILPPKKGLIVLASLATLLILSMATKNAGLVNNHFGRVMDTAPLSLNNKFDIADLNSYKDLPVGEVKSFVAPNSWGTAIFIPQYHKNPGSASVDAKNDSAQKDQEQIYQIIRTLVDKADVQIIAQEGDLTGEVPVTKIAISTDKIDRRNTFAVNLQKMKDALKNNSLDQKTENNLFAILDDKLKSTDRDIILEGAPLKIKGEGANVTLLGLENKDTQDASKELVRDYIYLQDRSDQLSSPNQSSSLTSSLGGQQVLPSTDPSLSLLNSKYGDLLQLLLNNKPAGDNTAKDFSTLTSLATSQQKNDLVKVIQDTNNAYQNLTANNQVAATTTTASSPSRADNPYNYITDPNQIKSLMDKDEVKINELIVDKRNQEASVNFAQGLKSTGKNVGILQFGAGHEDGLIKELNKQGISVIEIKSNEVISRNSQL